MKKKPPQQRKARVVRKRARPGSDSDSEDEWQPWKEAAEEDRRRLRKRGARCSVCGEPI